MFGHEKFKAYQIAIRFVELSLRILDKLEKGNADLRDQLKRAAMSIPLNIAEGSGRTSIVERRRYYTIARGSAMECAAVCDILLLLRREDDTDLLNAKSMLAEIAAILSAVCAK